MNAQRAIQQNENLAATKQHSVPVNHWAAGDSKENQSSIGAQMQQMTFNNTSQNLN